MSGGSVGEVRGEFSADLLSLSSLFLLFRLVLVSCLFLVFRLVLVSCVVYCFVSSWFIVFLVIRLVLLCS